MSHTNGSDPKTHWGAGLVTYRSLVAVMLTIIIGLVAALANDVRGTLHDSVKTLAAVQTNAARYDSRVDDNSERIGHNESAIQHLTEKDGTLDNRVTVLEHEN